MSINSILVDANGNQLAPVAAHGGIWPVVIRQTAATVAATIVWALWNPTASVKTIHVRSINLALFFDGVAAATLMKYELLKLTGVTAFSAGTALTPVHKRTSLSGALVGQAKVLDTGFTLTGGAAQQAIQIGAQGRVTQTVTAFSQSIVQMLAANERGTVNAMAIELAAQEALAIRLNATAVIGDNCVGYVETAEV